MSGCVCQVGVTCKVFKWVFRWVCLLCMKGLSLTLCPSLRPCAQHVETLHGRSCSDDIIVM